MKKYVIAFALVAAVATFAFQPKPAEAGCCSVTGCSFTC